MKIGFIAFVFILLLSHLARAQNFESHDGIYDMHIKIGERIFIDEVELHTRRMNFMRAELTGFVSVAGAFKAELTGTIQQLCGGTEVFSFSIVAHENGQDFKVKYDGFFEFDNGTTMQGSAFLEDGKLLGEFTAVKRK